MSVDIEEWMARDGLPPTFYLTDDSEGATRLRVGALRALGLQVGWDPDNGHEHHGAVWGIGSSHRKKIRRMAATIRKALGET